MFIVTSGIAAFKPLSLGLTKIGVKTSSCNHMWQGVNAPIHVNKTYAILFKFVSISCNILNVSCKAPLGIAGNGAIYQKTADSQV